MASHAISQIVDLLAAAAIAKGKAVKIGADDNHVVVGAANTDKVLGILQTATTAAEDVAEIAVGGGAKALLGESVVAGNLLVSHTDGSLVKANALGDFIIAKAMEAGASGDLIDVMVIHGHAAAAE